MKLYIVMPVINCFDLTVAALASIKSDCNVILIDNKSDDQTQEWGALKDHAMSGFSLNEHIKSFNYIRNEERKSVAQSWNQGVKIALADPECKYIAVLNNDILLHPKTLDHLMAFMDKTGYLMVTADNVRDRMSPETMMTLELPEKFTDYDLWPIEGWRSEGPDFSCFMISPETIRVIGWFDEKFIGGYCEDQDYHTRISRAREHIQKHNDQEIEANRVHAKRLSTAPYYHFSSQTIIKNEKLRPEIQRMHGLNATYRFQKWGAEHPDVMDGKGFVTPFGRADMSWRDW